MTDGPVRGNLWEQHCCLPLLPQLDVAELARYRHDRAVYLSVNIGYSRQDRAAATDLAVDIRAKVNADSRFRMLDAQVGTDVFSADAITVAFDLEDSGPLDGDLANVQYFHDLGVRSMLTTYNHRNAAGCGCLDAVDDGLTDYGRAVVAELNRVGMFVDGSHCSRRSGLDMASVTAAPMIYSHSNFAALHEHPRNITDEQARACAETGGVVGINGVGIFLGVNDPAAQTHRLRAMSEHVAYGADLLGVEHVGVGSDYSFDADDFNNELLSNPEAFGPEYSAWGPLQWVPPEDTITLDRELAARGFTPDEIAQVLGGNFARISSIVWPGIPPLGAE